MNLKAGFFHPGAYLQRGQRSLVAVAVYTSESKSSNGQVKMRTLTVPGREQTLHRPERNLSNGELLRTWNAGNSVWQTSPAI